MTAVIAPPGRHWMPPASEPSAATLDRSATPGIVPITVADRDAVDALFVRCSAQTRRLRFFGNVIEMPPAYLAGALAGIATEHDAVGAWQAGDLIGLASMVAMGYGTGELAILVDDAHQRQQLGTELAHQLVRRARMRGVTKLTASVLPGRIALLGWLARNYRLEDIAFAEDEVTATYEIGPRPDRGSR